MADTDLYETDILAWSEQQVSALRELATRRDLPNALDLPHMLEEIEGLGLSELHSVQSFIQLILRHAAKCVIDRDAPSLRHWHVEINNWQSELERRFSQSMRRRIDMDSLWTRAARQAELDLLEQQRDTECVRKAQDLRGMACPISLDDLLSDPTDPVGLVQRVDQGLSSR